MNADLIRLGENARRAAGALMVAAAPAKNAALEAIARTLEENAAEIFAANAEDIAAGKAAGIAPNLLDRMLLDEKRLAGIVEGVRQVAALKDPIGEVLHAETLPNGLIVSQMRVPLGVVGMIYEARPNVTVDAAVLCLKSGNAVILRGSKDILRSNICLVKLMRQALIEAGLDPDCIALVEDPSRETATAFMKLSGYLDVLIPRGGAGLIRSTVENATVPVIETGTGNCHVYVDKDADLEKALPILMNAKTQRTSVCNACESLLIHRAVADAFGPAAVKALLEKGVVIHGDETARTWDSRILPAAEEDYYKEYLALELSVKVVDSAEEAIAHINKYSTRHSDCIVSENYTTVKKFLLGVDSACVYANASTRFSDGFEFGLGAEIGISTQKLHARGPMGLTALTTYKYVVLGEGQVRG
ncbi:MAG: glutamate-5-semialdehyde dehydrogenase [Clostridiales bacterium]|nr:glutamate-5-semialdehyde dehydrogenase [Clostridiales bacterium]